MESHTNIIVPSKFHQVIFQDDETLLSKPGKHIVALSVKRMQEEFYYLLNVTVDGQEILNAEDSTEEIVFAGEELQFVTLIRGV